MITGYTKGPWKVGETLKPMPTIESVHDKRLAVAIVGDGRSSAEAWDNAKLMALAPAIIETLYDIADEYDIRRYLHTLGIDKE